MKNDESFLKKHSLLLAAILATAAVGWRIQQSYKRSGAGGDGESHVVDPKVAPTWTGSGAKGPDIAKGWIGWQIGDAADHQGVLVHEVYDGGPAQRAGIEKDDVIVSLGGENATQQRILDAILSHGPGFELEFEVRKPDGVMTQTVFVKIERKLGIDSLCMRTIALASSGLAALQLPDGLWPHYLPNPLAATTQTRSSVATSALACAALALAGKDGGDDATKALEKGLSVLLGRIAPDGGLDDPSDPMAHRVYANSFLLLALAQEPAAHPKELASVQAWLARTQIGGEGWEWVDPLDTRYGGWSYHTVDRAIDTSTPNAARTASKTLRADISVASWALDALAASKLPSDRVEWSRAARFLERCQNRELHSTREAARKLEAPYRDGGFSFSPRYSKASSASVGEELIVPRSYGSATADGLRGLIAVSTDDFDGESREAAVQWLGRNYTLASNPGFADPDMSGWSRGVYFYWLASLARALDAAKVERIDRGPNDTHAWPDELARFLANIPTFYTKHVFASLNDQMHEDSPTTSTAFAVIALAAARDRVRAGDGRVLVTKPVAPPPPERKPWIAQDLSLLAKGRALFESGAVGCTGCHTETDHTNGPSLAGVGDRFVAKCGSVEAARDYFKKHVRDPDKNPGTNPGPYRDVGKTMTKYDEKSTGLTDEMLDAIVEYLLSR